MAVTPGFVRAKLAPTMPFLQEPGVQLYTLREELKKDLPGTMKALISCGYKQAEGYASDLFPEMLKVAKGEGLAVHSSHVNASSIVAPSDDSLSDFQKLLEQAVKDGLKHVVIPYLDLHHRVTADGYKRVAGRMNAAAVKARAAGVQLAYHNHAFEFAPFSDGKSGFDHFVAEFGEAMKFELDVFWVKVGGHDPVELLGRLKGRVSQLHLKDLKKGLELPNYGTVPQDAFEELGDGSLDMAAIMVAGAAAGAVHAHVEQDHSPHPMQSVTESMMWLKKA